MADYQMYTTVENALRYLDNGQHQGSLAPDALPERTYIWQQIGLASSMVQQYTERAFVPEYGDIDISGGVLWDSVTVSVSHGIIALESVNGDDALAGYTVLPAGNTIGYFVRKTGGWTFDNDGNAIFTGWFGYHPNYAVAWQTIETVTIDSNQTTIAVADDIRYETGDTLRIEDELLLIVGIAANTLTVERGINGTTAEVHTLQSVRRYRLPEPVKQVTTEIVAWLYKNRHRINEVFAVPGGTVRVGSFDPELYKPLNRYRLECANITPYG